LRRVTLSSACNARKKQYRGKSYTPPNECT
jgi:hypothetical protein